MDILFFHFPISAVETFIFIPPLVAFTISFFTSMAGISGAFLLLPFQMSVLGFTAPSVTSTNFLYNVSGYSFSTGKLLILALGVGIIGGIYGIGGGSIIAPFLITFFRLPVYAIAGAVLLGTFVSSLAGVAFYSLIPIKGAVAAPDWLLGILFGVGGLIGMYFGAKAQKRVSEKWIKLILGVVVSIVALKYILKFFWV